MEENSLMRNFKMTEIGTNQQVKMTSRQGEGEKITGNKFAMLESLF